MKMRLPEIKTYGNYSSDNYGAHCLRVDVGPLTVWFSYRTPIAFHVNGSQRVIRENSWGITTGKHLNWIDKDKKKRVSGEEFEKLWKEQVEKLFNAEEQVKILDLPRILG